MKYTKGFTLIELLAVITLLGLLGLIALEAIESVNKGNQKKAEAIQRQSILAAAIAYAPTSKVKLPNTELGASNCVLAQYKVNGTYLSSYGKTICEVRIFLDRLAKEGLLENEIKNPLTDEYINMNSAYVSIYYVEDLASIDEERRKKGKFDGHYFYELVY